MKHLEQKNTTCFTNALNNAEDKNLKNIGESLSTCYFPPL